MQHDEHFLSRLSRLDREHAEIALGLYYDSPLVRHILRVADIPDGVDRVALCLGTPEQGPFIIVARDGHFVTCLGEGMRLAEGQPLISRHRLDTISETASSLRSMLAEARAGSRAQTRRKLARVFEAGAGLSQQEFEDISRWLPLLDVAFLSAHVNSVERCTLLVEHLSRRKLKRRDDELLYDYWCTAWSIVHLTMLLASDGGATLRQLLGMLEETDPGLGAQLPWCSVRLGVSSFALRGVWVASKLPTLTVPMAKHRYLDPRASYLTTLTDGLSLAAVGLRHRKYYAEVQKTINKGAPPPDSKDTIAALRGVCAAYFEQHHRDPKLYLDHTIDISRTFLRELYHGRPQEQLDAIEQLPDDIAVALFISMPLGVADPTVACGLFGRLPWIVGVDAKAFYLPEPCIVWLRNPWTRDDGLAVLRARIDCGVPRQQPVVATPKIGRNEPCPCGSGKKYKRCCGGPNPPAG